MCVHVVLLALSDWKDQARMDAVVVVYTATFSKQQRITVVHDRVLVAADHEDAGFRVNRRFKDRKIRSRCDLPVVVTAHYTDATKHMA
jgi:hypothetical protein